MTAIPDGHPCKAKIAQAISIAREVTGGQKLVVDGARDIGRVAFVDCYDFLNEDVSTVDLVATLYSLTEDYETPGRSFKELAEIEAEMLQSIEALAQLRG